MYLTKVFDNVYLINEFDQMKLIKWIWLKKFDRVFIIKWIW